MTTKKGKAFAAGDEALPGAEDLSRYARTYTQLGDHAERHFLLWQLSSAHAMLLEQDGDRIHAEFGGLNGRQLDTRKNRLISGGTVGPARFRDDARPQAA